MLFKFKATLKIALAMLVIISGAAGASVPATTLIGEELHVFPGDRFYVEAETVEVPVYELEAPFQGRIPGAMRIRFSFAIDTTDLHFDRRTADWDYFAAPGDKVRAWHGLLGNVIKEGDSIGIRVHRRTGEMEWYVDNSQYNNGMTAIWTRKVRPSRDVAVREVGRTDVLLEGDRLRALEYLGERDGQLRIRYIEAGPSPRTDEFLFPVSDEQPFVIGVMGLRAEVRAVDGASARIKVIRGFEGDGLAKPAGRL